jgi:hypothetical protein
MGCVNSTPQKGSEPHDERKASVEGGNGNGVVDSGPSTSNNVVATPPKELDDDPYIIEYPTHPPHTK